MSKSWKLRKSEYELQVRLASLELSGSIKELKKRRKIYKENSANEIAQFNRRFIIELRARRDCFKDLKEKRCDGCFGVPVVWWFSRIKKASAVWDIKPLCRMCARRRTRAESGKEVVSETQEELRLKLPAMERAAYVELLKTNKQLDLKNSDDILRIKRLAEEKRAELRKNVREFQVKRKLL